MTIGTYGASGALERVMPDDQDLFASGTSGLSFNWKIRFWNRGLNENFGNLVKDELKRVGFPVASLDDRENGARDIVAWLNVKHRNGRPKKGHGGKKSATQSSNRNLAVSAYRSAIDKYEPSWLNETEGKHLSNFLSLGMYSGPEIHTREQIRYYLGAHANALYPRGYDRRWNKDRLPGWIGTGDAPLGEPIVWSDFKLHYSHELPRTQTILVPHHGAAPQKGPRFYNADLNHQPNLNTVISYGTYNGYGHPHPSVLSQIARTDGNLIAVTEKTKLGFQEDYGFF
ncbi:hypothetical protein ACIOUF_15810 [Pseudomonas iridis]|uniref:Uncharacterized protein n=1 Tax=Pseudomonas iridis TaxID=2710587 RepID=A0ABW8DKS1_9PSED